MQEALLQTNHRPFIKHLFYIEYMKIRQIKVKTVCLNFFGVNA